MDQILIALMAVPMPITAYFTYETSRSCYIHWRDEERRKLLVVFVLLFGSLLFYQVFGVLWMCLSRAINLSGSWLDVYVVVRAVLFDVVLLGFISLRRNMRTT